MVIVVHRMSIFRTEQNITIFNLTFFCKDILFSLEEIPVYRDDLCIRRETTSTRFNGMIHTEAKQP